MCLIDKDRDSAFITNRECDFAWKKIPCGSAHTVAPNLVSICFMCSTNKHKDSAFIKNKNVLFVEEKAPAGTHTVAPNSESTCFMCPIHKNKDSVFVKIESLIPAEKESLRERPHSRTELRKYKFYVFTHRNMFLQHVSFVLATYECCICSI